MDDFQLVRQATASSYEMIWVYTVCDFIISLASFWIAITIIRNLKGLNNRLMISGFIVFAIFFILLAMNSLLEALTNWTSIPQIFCVFKALFAAASITCAALALVVTPKMAKLIIEKELHEDETQKRND